MNPPRTLETPGSLDRLWRRAELLFDESRDAMRESLLLKLQAQYIRNRIVTGEPVRARSPEPVNAGPSALNVLTPRERSVLELVVKGKSTREIGALLQISFKTAACHRSAIMSKLEVHKSASLVREAYRLGLVQE